MGRAKTARLAGVAGRIVVQPSHPMRSPSQERRRPRIEEKRRGQRMNSRVPLLVEWENSSGEKNSERAFTRIVSPYGCMMVFPQDLSVEQSLQVLNTSTQQSNAAVVVWKGKQNNEGWELGVELTQPPMGFWGIEL
jgi:hypothetical protein